MSSSSAWSSCVRRSSSNSLRSVCDSRELAAVIAWRRCARTHLQLRPLLPQAHSAFRQLLPLEGKSLSLVVDQAGSAARGKSDRWDQLGSH